jgi:hypothetical protein
MSEVPRPNWRLLRERYTNWWQRKGYIVHILAPRDHASADPTHPQAPFYHLMGGLDTTVVDADEAAIVHAWIDAPSRARAADRYLTGICFEGNAFPYFDTQLGPGNLATFLGSAPRFFVDTVWYAPCIDDLEAHPPLQVSPDNPWLQRQKAILEAGMTVSAGRYPVSMPDLVENLDVLASLRGTQKLMVDMIERPAVVEARLAEINQAYFEVFAQCYDIIAGPWGGNVFSAFSIWGPGKTAKIQCDACVMISESMFERFVAPSLSEQCTWLDFSMYHLDGTQAMRHLDALLSIDALDAIEWTPQVSIAQGGSPDWFPLYRRILDAGKGVQIINVRPDEVIPLLDAIGTQGVFVMVNAASESEARLLTEKLHRFES